MSDQIIPVPGARYKKRIAGTLKHTFLTLSRSLNEIREMSTKSKDNYCCDRKPLFSFELDHIVVDELHLMLRVTDILTENIIAECLDRDKEDDLDRGCIGENLSKLSYNAGLKSFDVWEQRNDDGKAK